MAYLTKGAKLQIGGKTVERSACLTQKFTNTCDPRYGTVVFNPYISKNGDILDPEKDEKLIGNLLRDKIVQPLVEYSEKDKKFDVLNSIRIKTDNALGMLANATNDEDIQGAALQMTEAMSLIQGQVESGEITETQGALKSEQLAKGFAEQSFLNPILRAETSEEAYAALEAEANGRKLVDTDDFLNAQEMQKNISQNVCFILLPFQLQKLKIQM